MSNQVAPVVREYIEIGAGYVVATKGDGSTYRIHAPDDAERVIVLPEFYHPFYTQMAKAIAAERAAASGELERLRAENEKLQMDHGFAIGWIKGLANNPHKPMTWMQTREAAADFVANLEAALAKGESK